MTLGIMSAMKEEIDNLIAEMGPETEVVRVGMREFHKGVLWGKPVVLVFSRWGKVAAATTATTLINQFGVDRIIFTGVAGAVERALEVGDIVVGSKLYQHDMDARPLFPRHEIPLLGVKGLWMDLTLRQAVLAAARKLLIQDLPSFLAPQVLEEFGIFRPMVIEGEIASGDKFFARGCDLRQLKRDLPTVECVEMEGGAVAQVCYEHGVPCAVIRIISDAANESAPVDLARFTRQVAGPYSLGILRNLLAEAEAGPAYPPAATDTASPRRQPSPGDRLQAFFPEGFVG
jgi:adenosylhomocysteine nucleosidase